MTGWIVIGRDYVRYLCTVEVVLVRLASIKWVSMTILSFLTGGNSTSDSSLCV